MPKAAPRTVAFKNGMQTLTDALFEELGDSVRLECLCIVSKRISSNGFSIEKDAGSENVSAVVICVPAHAASRGHGEF